MLKRRERETIADCCSLAHLRCRASSSLKKEGKMTKKEEREREEEAEKRDEKRLYTLTVHRSICRVAIELVREYLLTRAVVYLASQSYSSTGLSFSIKSHAFRQQNRQRKRRTRGERESEKKRDGESERRIDC